MSMSDGGKGSSPRPFSVSNEEYAQRWDAIFGREPKKTGQKYPHLVDGCQHGVWTHTGEMYKCLDCGIEAEKPYISR